MVIVRFRRNAPPYAAGELAGFPAEKADRLEQEGVVEKCDGREPEDQKEDRAPAKRAAKR